MKRMLHTVCLAAVLLLVGAFGVGAGTAQQVVLSEFGESLMLSAQQEPAVWEQPTLQAGEALATPGTLTLANNTTAEHTVTLDSVELPYDNTAALTYLNHLHLTVCEGDTVLYSGPYSRINDKDGGLVLSRRLAPGETATYTVGLRCDYTFTGDSTGLENGTLLNWQFYTVVQTPANATAAAFSDPALREVLLAVGAAAVLLAVVVVAEWVKKKKAEK